MSNLLKGAKSLSSKYLLIEEQIKENYASNGEFINTIYREQQMNNQIEMTCKIIHYIVTITKEVIKENQKKFEKKFSKTKNMINHKQNTNDNFKSLLHNNENKYSFYNKEKIEKRAEEFQGKKIKELKSDYFRSDIVPKISLMDFLCRLRNYLNCENSTFILSLIYIDKLTSDKANKIILNGNNVHKLFLTSLLLAIKFNEDDFFNNEIYAKVAGVEIGM